MFKRALWGIIALIIATCFLSGCSHSDEDVTLKPEYNFTSFAGTVWKTKVKLALANQRRYTGDHQIFLLAPSRFDPSVSDYIEVSADEIITVLPLGTLVRIDRYTVDHGPGNANNVWATVFSGEYAKKTVILDKLLLSDNQWLWPGGRYSSTNWGVNSNMLEKADAP